MRYYSPYQSQYVSQFVAAPLDYLQKSLEAKQGQYDKEAAKVQAVNDFLGSLTDGYRTQGLSKHLNDTYKQEAEDILNSGDLTNGSNKSKIMSFVSKVRNDQKVKLVQQDFAEGNKQYDEYSKKEKYNLAIDHNKNKDGSFKQLDWNGPYNPYGNVVDNHDYDMDWAERGKLLVPDIKDVLKEGTDITLNAQGDYVVSDLSGKEIVLNDKQQKVIDALNGYANNYYNSNNPGSAYWRGRKQFNGEADDMLTMKQEIADNWKVFYRSQTDTEKKQRIDNNSPGAVRAGAKKKEIDTPALVSGKVLHNRRTIIHDNPTDFLNDVKSFKDNSIKEEKELRGFAKEKGLTIPAIKEQREANGIPYEVEVQPEVELLDIRNNPETGEAVVTFDQKALEAAVAAGRIPADQAGHLKKQYDANIDNITASVVSMNQNNHSYQMAMKMDKEFKQQADKAFPNHKIQPKLIEEADNYEIEALRKKLSVNSGSTKLIPKGSTKEEIIAQAKAWAAQGVGMSEVKSLIPGYKEGYTEEQLATIENSIKEAQSEKDKILEKDPKRKYYNDLYREHAKLNHTTVNGYLFGTTDEDKRMKENITEFMKSQGKNLVARDMNGEIVTFPEDWNPWTDPESKVDLTDAQWRVNEENKMVVQVRLPGLKGAAGEGVVEVEGIDGFDTYLLKQKQVDKLQLGLLHQVQDGLNQRGDNTTSIGEGEYELEVEQLRFKDGTYGRPGQFKVVVENSKGIKEPRYFDSKADLINFQIERMHAKEEEKAFNSWNTYVAEKSPEEFAKLQASGLVPKADTQEKYKKLAAELAGK